MDLNGRIIYVLKGWVRDDLYKIGCTRDIRKRYPKRLRDRIVAVIPVPDHVNLYEAEREIQQLFREHNVNGFEAFSLSEDDISLLRTLVFF